MRVLVTGGCGYIGSALVPRLQDDDAVSRVTVLDNLSTGSPANLTGADVGRDDLAFREGDVREYGAVEAAVRDVDVVIHLAAITGAESTHGREAETRAVNRGGTENVLKAARKFDVDRVVFASSCNNYGRAESREIDETVEPDPINPYARAKHESERLLADYADDYGLETTALRMSTNYGYAPGVRFNLVVNTFVFRALTDRPLTVYGDGSNWRPFIHVEDAARSFRTAATDPDRWPRQVYNVGADAANYRIATVADVVDMELDCELDVNYLREKQPGPSYHVDFGRLEETGFEPEWTLPTGIRDLAARLGADGPTPDGPASPARGESDV